MHTQTLHVHLYNRTLNDDRFIAYMDKLGAAADKGDELATKRLDRIAEEREKARLCLSPYQRNILGM